jgi:hypothetical protein
MDYSDNGYKSRKMVMSYIVILLISLGFLGTGVWPALAASFGTFIMGILAAASIFTGANTAVQWMAHQANLKGIGATPDPVPDVQVDVTATATATATPPQ